MQSNNIFIHRPVCEQLYWWDYRFKGDVIARQLKQVFNEKAYLHRRVFAVWFRGSVGARFDANFSAESRKQKVHFVESFSFIFFGFVRSCKFCLWISDVVALLILIAKGAWMCHWVISLSIHEAFTAGRISQFQGTLQMSINILDVFLSQIFPLQLFFFFFPKMLFKCEKFHL